MKVPTIPAALCSLLSMTALSLTALSPTALCAQDPTPAATKKLDEARYDHFGAGIVEGAAPAGLARVLASPQEFTGKKVRVTGTIGAVCQTKGCWLTVGKPDAKGNPPMFVKFKDYAFFAPKDAAGRDVILEGTMTFKQETVEESRHFLEDEGRHEEAAKLTEGRRLFHFMADGIAIEKPHKLDETRYDHFGAGIMTGAEPVTIADVIAEPEQFQGKTIRLTGPITGVCQTKGCWMNLGAVDAKGNPPVFVKFKDYAFFMPKDAAGRTAIVEGTISVTQETVAETRHHLEDAGKHEEAQKVTEGRKVLKFMAAGVAIEKRADAKATDAKAAK